MSTKEYIAPLVDTLELARHEFLYAHAMLSSKGVPALDSDGQPMALSQRLNIFMLAYERLNENGAGRR